MMYILKQVLVWVVTLCFINSVVSVSVLKQDNGIKSAEKYKILMLLPFCSRSHRNTFLTLANGLADRGHEVILLSGHHATATHPNVKEINHKIEILHPNISDFFQSRKESPFGVMNKVVDSILNFTSIFYEIPDVKKLYESRKTFDLTVIQYRYNEFCLPFLHEMPYISINPAGYDSVGSSLMGNPHHPAYMTSYLKHFPLPMSLLDRLLNTLIHIGLSLGWNNFVGVPNIEILLSKKFRDLPPLMDLIKNESLMLLNSHSSHGVAHPLLPNQVQVGGLHCREGKPLPKPLEYWFDNAGPEGVVYFSLGSMAKGSNMPEKYFRMFIKVFTKLGVRVLWKYEGSVPKDLKKNIMMQDWLPQQNVLAHPKVRLFISQGGLLSMQEAIYHETPLLIIPLMGDQHSNANWVQDQGVGLKLDWDALNSKRLKRAILEVLHNQTYYKNIKVKSRQLKDQPQSPLETAVWWTEYVIRHRGAPQLESPAKYLSWFEFFMLDVILVLEVVLISVIYLIRKCFMIFRKGKRNVNKKKRE